MHFATRLAGVAKMILEGTYKLPAAVAMNQGEQ